MGLSSRDWRQLQPEPCATSACPCLHPAIVPREPKASHSSFPGVQLHGQLSWLIIVRLGASFLKQPPFIRPPACLRRLRPLLSRV